MGFVFPNLSDGATKRRSAEGKEEDALHPSSLRASVPPSLRPSEWKPLPPRELTLEDRWILSRLSETIARVDDRIDNYRFAEAVDALYAFFWNDFCDWYVELVKPRLYGGSDGATERRSDEGPAREGKAPAEPQRSNREGEAPAEPQRSNREGEAPAEPSASIAGQASELIQRVQHTLDDDAARASAAAARQVLAWVLDQTLRLLHPIAPFITEKLWAELNRLAPQRGVSHLVEALGGGGPEAHRTGHGLAAHTPLCIALWPRADLWEREPGIEREMAITQDVIRALRDTLARVNALRSQAKEKALRTLPSAFVKADGEIAAQLRGHLPMLRRLGSAEAIEIGPNVAKPPQSASKVLTGIEVYVPLAGLADPAIEIARLGKERDETARYAQQLEGKLGNAGYVDRAPADVVARDRARLAELQEKLAAIERNLAELRG
jgi:valyl-tRNA synthetase